MGKFSEDRAYSLMKTVRDAVHDDPAYAEYVITGLTSGARAAVFEAREQQNSAEHALQCAMTLIKDERIDDVLRGTFNALIFRHYSDRKNLSQTEKEFLDRYKVNPRDRAEEAEIRAKYGD